MENKYKDLSKLRFSEVNIGLGKTEFIKEYSKLSFNGFFFIKTFESNSFLEFKNYLNSIHKPLEDFDVNIAFQSATIDAKAFIYYLFKNKSLKEMSPNFYEDSDFLNISPQFDSLEGFSNISVAELNRLKLHRHLVDIAKQGSVYEDWNFSERITSKFIYDFLEELFQNNNYRIFRLEDWMGYDLGFFACFLIINLDKAQITFFAKDDYD